MGYISRIRRPAAPIRKLESRLLMHVFCEALGVEAPKLCGLSAAQSLQTFVEFSAACMELAQEDERVACLLRARLGERAEALGRLVRMACPAPLAARRALARYLYQGIGIELAQPSPTALRFGPCRFARRYTPEDCWFMSAFDEGFLRGLWACPQADLVFSCRLTQGANCCRAHLTATPR